MVWASVLILYTTTNFDSKEHKSYKSTRALAKTLRTVIDPHRDHLLACMVSATHHRRLPTAALAGLGVLTPSGSPVLWGAQGDRTAAKKNLEALVRPLTPTQTIEEGRWQAARG